MLSITSKPAIQLLNFIQAARFTAQATTLWATTIPEAIAVREVQNAIGVGNSGRHPQDERQCTVDNHGHPGDVPSHGVITDLLMVGAEDLRDHDFVAKQVEVEGAPSSGVALAGRSD